MSDRTVHCTLIDNSDIVRYDRAGKWYREWPPTARTARKPLTLSEAVELAALTGERYYFDRPGGGAFDRGVRRAVGGGVR